jgi:hypothetical protein
VEGCLPPGIGIHNFFFLRIYCWRFTTFDFLYRCFFQVFTGPICIYCIKIGCKYKKKNILLKIHYFRYFYTGTHVKYPWLSIHTGIRNWYRYPDLVPVSCQFFQLILVPVVKVPVRVAKVLVLSCSQWFGSGSAFGYAFLWRLNPDPDWKKG